jgi:hypothetical protein
MSVALLVLGAWIVVSFPAAVIFARLAFGPAQQRV